MCVCVCGHALCHILLSTRPLPLRTNQSPPSHGSPCCTMILRWLRNPTHTMSFPKRSSYHKRKVLPQQTALAIPTERFINDIILRKRHKTSETTSTNCRQSVSQSVSQCDDVLTVQWCGGAVVRCRHRGSSQCSTKVNRLNHSAWQ